MRNMKANARATIAMMTTYVMVSLLDIMSPPPVDVTEIAFEMLSVALLLSVTVRLTMYAPLLEYTCVGF